MAKRPRWVNPQRAAKAATLVPSPGSAFSVDLAGGQVLVQDPAEAEFNGMPRSALAVAPRARAVPTMRLASEICDAVRAARGDRG
jgi:hypothetical protein